jgi:two-component system phosphate regulon sensor histidine kinase PhoR
MQRRPLFWQIFPAYVFLTVGLLLLLLLESKGKFRDFYREQISVDLAASASMFGELANVSLERGRYGEVEALAKRLGKASGLRITVVLPTGKVVAESTDDPALLESHRTRPEIATALDTRTMAHDMRYSITLQQDMLYVAVPLLRRGEPWVVVRMSKPATAVNDTLVAFERRMIYGALTAAVLIVAVSWLLARRISRPLEAITRGVERFGRGELAYRLPVDGSREIALLAKTMNTLGEQLREQIDAIAVGRSEEEAILQSMEEGVLTLDNQGRILNLNRAAGQMFQLDPEKACGRPLHEVLRKADVLKFVEHALSGPLPLQEEIVIYGPERRHLAASGRALCNASQQRIGVLAVFRDVTATRRTSPLPPGEG